MTCVSERKTLPKTEQYLPRLVDANLGSGDVSFQPNYERKRLFVDKVFYFLDSEQVSWAVGLACCDVCSAA